MAVGNFIFFLLTTLVAVNLIFAESPQSDSKHDTQVQDGGDQQPSGRFFFGGFSTCNYTATPGATCTSCTTALRCFSNNQGLVRTCRGFLPYCNAGRCSFIAASNCTGSGSHCTCCEL